MAEIDPSSYKHFRTGTIYTVVTHAVDADSREECVVYSCRENGEALVWIRPAHEFYGLVKAEGTCPKCKMEAVHPHDLCGHLVRRFELVLPPKGPPAHKVVEPV